MRLAGLLSHALMVIRETVRHQRLHSPNVDTLDIREEKLIDLLQSLPLLLGTHWHFALFREEQIVLRWRAPYQCLGWNTATWFVSDCVDHVGALGLASVVFLLIWTSVGISPIPIRPMVVPQAPLEKWHRLDVKELTVLCSAQDIGKPNSCGIGVGGNFHHATGLHETSQGPEEEVHQVLMSPSHKRVAIEKALHHSGMWKVVVDCPKAVLHSLETRIDSKPGAIHIVQDFCMPVLKLLDSALNLGIAFTQDFVQFLYFTK